MAEYRHRAKRSRLSVDEVLLELEEEEGEPVTAGSDDEFEDMACVQRKRDLDDIIADTAADQSEPPYSPPAHSPSPPATPSTASPTIPPQLSCSATLPPQPSCSAILPPQPSCSTTLPPQPSCSTTIPPQPSCSTHTSQRSSSTTWSTTLTPVDIAPFTQEVGPTVSISLSPLDVFGLFFTDDICSHILHQSNLYAEQVLGEEKYGDWEEISSNELRAYFGFMILMGLYPKPARRDYWKRDPFVGYAERISRDRFYDIGRYLHFADNAALVPQGQPGYDRLGKVREVMEKVSDRFYKPHCENSVDEAMIPFQGRSSLKQYMPAKPVKRGIKVWCRADAHNGYLCQFEVYTGRSEGVQDRLGKRVVLGLSQKLEGLRYHLYFDNFFTSVWTRGCMPVEQPDKHTRNFLLL